MEAARVQRDLASSRFLRVGQSVSSPRCYSQMLCQAARSANPMLTNVPRSSKRLRSERGRMVEWILRNKGKLISSKKPSRNPKPLLAVRDKEPAVGAKHQKSIKTAGRAPQTN